MSKETRVLTTKASLGLQKVICNNGRVSKVQNSLEDSFACQNTDFCQMYVLNICDWGATQMTPQTGGIWHPRLRLI